MNNRINFGITSRYFGLALLATVALSSCKKDDEGPAPITNESDLSVKKVSDLDAGDGNVFFSLETGEEIAQSDSNSTKWDVAFNGTTILVNGGTSGPGKAKAIIVDGIFENIAFAPVSGYSEDAVPKTWYTYNNPEGSHLVKPIAGKNIVVKTANGKFAKIEIISYYKGNPDLTGKTYADVESRYYTFRYVFQPDGTIMF